MPSPRRVSIPRPTVTAYSCGHVIAGGKDARPYDPLGIKPLEELPEEHPARFVVGGRWHGSRKAIGVRVDQNVTGVCPWCLKMAEWKRQGVGSPSDRDCFF